METHCVTDLADGTQQWEEDEFCDAYESTWEISTEEVHYGWLADGENRLELLKGTKLSGANILDLGCGMAQNLIALAKRGVKGFGLDISSCMLRKASALIAEEGLEDAVILQQGDMREQAFFEGIEFDLVLSIYSMEYLSGVQELRAVVHDVRRRLKPNGIFILCFSHPSQAHRYPELMNCSVPIGSGKYRTYNYSIKDATEALFKEKFSIERVVEQKTKNPSKISYRDGLVFPYHFREGNNPCTEEYDEVSNGNPHTIIYKCVNQQPIRERKFRRRDSLAAGYRELWGYRRKILKHNRVRFFGYDFDAMHLAPRDNILGIVDVLDIQVRSDECESGASLSKFDDEEKEILVDQRTVLGRVLTALDRMGLQYRLKTYHVQVGESGAIVEKRIYISEIFGLSSLVEFEFGTTKIGLLCFVNGDEPSQGEIPIDIVMGVPGDRISLLYLAYRDKIQENIEGQLQLGF